MELLGKGAYGTVHKGMLKTGEIVAVKKIPLDTDLQSIIKEISIMKQCDHPSIVKYYGTHVDRDHLWIIMEYCGGGSISDILELLEVTLEEEQIASVLKEVLVGLDYFHEQNKIHRDIKAGNILLTDHGDSKLADFGVSGQLSDSMAKRQTVIGTPFWMAPEMIQEVGYGIGVDIWSLGITILEMAEGKPPLSDLHPMRAIFQIPSSPPPKFKDPDRWSKYLVDFLTVCLEKNPENRATAKELIEHPFLKRAKPTSQTLLHYVDQLKEIREEERESIEENSYEGSFEGSQGSYEGSQGSYEGSETESSEDMGTFVRAGTPYSDSESSSSEEKALEDMNIQELNDFIEKTNAQMNAELEKTNKEFEEKIKMMEQVLMTKLNI